MALVVLIGWMWKNYVAPATIIGKWKRLARENQRCRRP
jgi:hypothetical protein